MNLIFKVVFAFFIVSFTSGVISTYAAQYINDDYKIEFQYPDNWNVSQKNATTNYGLEYDFTILFEIKSPEIYEWKWLDINSSDTALIRVGFQHDISNLKQYTQLFKKSMITSESSVTEIKYDGRVIDYGNTSSVMISGIREGLGTDYIIKVLLFQKGTIGYFVSYYAPSKLATDEHMHILENIFENIVKSGRK